MKKQKVLLIGWDAADWKVINPLIDAGEMPTLEKLINGGSMGNLATLDPPFSPTLWTSIATGKRPYKHGIYGFIEPDPSGKGVRPVHITSRKVRAIWNILCNKNYKCHQVGWWPSHPAEPINGVYISNFYQRANAPITEPWPMADGTVHPSEKSDLYAALRVHPQELTAAHLQPFLPQGHLLNQQDPKIQKKLSSLAKVIADCSTIHSAATYILDNEEWDFLAVYYDAIDHFSHGFMRYHPPRRPHIDKNEYEAFKHVITAGYKYHDMMLEGLLRLVPDDTMIMLISDHGFHPDHLRPISIPKEAAGPAVEHSPYGIIVAKGPGIKKDEIVYGASLIDITPTILHYLSLPIGSDMDGKVLNTLFETKRKVAFISSYDMLEGDFYEHPEDFAEDPAESEAALKQLVDLGYIAAPGPDVEKDVEKIKNDLKFYEARAFIDAGKYSMAIPLLEDLHENQPDNTHIAYRLTNAYLQLRKTGKARKTIMNIRKVQQKETITTLVMQARVLLQEGEKDKALHYINQALAIRQDAPGLLLSKGKILMALEEFENAEITLNEAVEHDPHNAATYQELGKLYALQEKNEESINAYLEAIGLQFLSTEAHFGLGQVLEKIGNYEAAAHAYNNSNHIKKGHIRAKRRLVDIYENHLNRPKLAAAIQATLPDYNLPEMIVVSGLPRSGTSMMMQMLKAAGLEPFTDGQRAPDENNSKGYFEHELIKYLPKDQKILREVGDKVVKVVAPLLFHLPLNYRYKVIFMEREMGEILLSQHKMLKRNKKKKQQETFSFKLWQKMEDIVNQVKNKFATRRSVEILFLNHRDVVEDPFSAAREICEFLDLKVDLSVMSQVVDKQLYRERESVN